MNFSELDKLLCELDEDELLFKLSKVQINDMAMENETRKMYSLEKNKEDFIINSKMLMKEGENFAIHRHKRFLKFGDHKHDYIELIYVYKGLIKQKVNGIQVDINEGEICILDLNVTHSIEPAGENDIGINIIMTSDFFDSMFMSFLSENDIMSHFIIKTLYHKKEYKEHLLIKSSKNEFIQVIMKRLLIEYYEKKVSYDTAIHAYIILLFTEFLRDYKEKMGDSREKDLNREIINEVKKYLYINYREADLKTTAEHFHFNSDYFSKLLKGGIGISFTDILQDIKLKESALLIKNSDLNISEIMDKIGYNNLSYFYKLFKKKYGLTPIEYRNNLNNKN